eukprot:4108242-Pyramimonas_sp.AAC.1
MLSPNPPTYEDVVKSSASAYPTVSPQYARESLAPSTKNPTAAAHDPTRVFNIVLSDPVRQADTLADYTTYRVTTRTTHP